MRTVETTGRTVEEAVEASLEELGVGQDDVEIEILEEPNRGLFGIIGSKQARVKVTVKIEPEKIAEDFLYSVVEKMNMDDVEIESEEREGYLYLSLSGENMGLLIGRRGETLDALQYLVNLVVNKRLFPLGERVRIILDIEGYRAKREKTLVNLAQKISMRVRRTGNKVVLEPMNPHERRIIHTALQGDDEVQTYSEGVEPYRKVVVAPKNRNSQIH
jgi:spoIIIJ-associated protein